MTSTFAFSSAAQGAEHFQRVLHPQHKALNERKARHSGHVDYIYTRIDNPGNKSFIHE